MRLRALIELVYVKEWLVIFSDEFPNLLHNLI